jgi:heme/copper-type cytochrome/quinol oxidase subunit 2
MGHHDGAHTHGSGGSGAALMILAAVLVVAIARPVAHAAIEILRAVLIAIAVMFGVGVAGLVAFIAWRIRRPGPGHRDEFPGRRPS